MPGPHFAAPKPPPRPSTRRRFTLAQANRALPLVQRIVRDIVQAHEHAAEVQVRLTAHLGGSGAAAAQKELEDAFGHLQAYLDELEDIGCELKDYQMGLVDFTGRHDGRDVCLCWKLGEERIAYWHELHTGFAGRQLVESLRETD